MRHRTDVGLCRAGRFPYSSRNPDRAVLATEKTLNDPNIAVGRHGRSWLSSPFAHALIALGLGLLAGWLLPGWVSAYRAISDAFVKLLRLIITPIVFVTVANGLGSVRDLRRAGTTGLKALVYFEVVTTAALGIGLVVAHLIQPGAGLNVAPASLNTSQIAPLVDKAHQLTVADFFLNIIPRGLAAPFVDNEMLQVLFLAILVGVAMAQLGRRVEVIQSGLNQVQHLLFTITGYIMKLFAPLAVFGATAFTIAEYGSKALLSFATLISALYAADAAFVFLVLGSILALARINLFRLLAYLREEVLLVLATAASELAMPSMMKKLEHLGCDKNTVGLVMPAGYTFNLDGSAVYLTLAFLFIAQATNTPLSLGQELLVLGIMILTSKGAAGVQGAAFVALAATIASYPVVPIGGVALLLGVNRFLSIAGSLTNMIGNAIATVTLARWEDRLDIEKAREVLSGRQPFAASRLDE